MRYCIVKDNVIVNVIVCDNDEIALKLGAYPISEELNIGDKYEVPGPSPSELRENAYNTEPIVEFGGQTLTVTEAAQLWQYYAAEANPKAEELSVLIAEAKSQIRAKYPD